MKENHFSKVKITSGIAVKLRDVGNFKSFVKS